MFDVKGDKTLGQVCQRGSRCLMPGSILGQVVWGSEQPALVENVPDDYRGVELDGH